MLKPKSDSTDGRHGAAIEKPSPHDLRCNLEQTGSPNVWAFKQWIPNETISSHKRAEHPGPHRASNVPIVRGNHSQFVVFVHDWVWLQVLHRIHAEHVIEQVSDARVGQLRFRNLEHVVG
jgi:hypothetical protein